MTRWALGLAAVAVLGCAAGSNGASSTGVSSGTGGRGHADGGTDGGTGGGTGGGMPDGGPIVGDALPPSAVSFFQGASCPPGWVPYTAGDGFLLVPTVATAPGGIAHGHPLSSGEDRTHTHNIAATFSPSSVSYAGVSSGGNGGVGPSDSVTLKTASGPASTGLPYIQLLVCRKNDPAVPGSAPLPHGMEMFFDMAACPVGWVQTTATQGRFIVGLPQGAPQDVSFGGSPLSSGDGGVDVRLHAHGVTATLTTTSHGIALVSNGAATGYAGNGMYMSTVQTSSDEPALPYLELLACQVP